MKDETINTNATYTMPLIVSPPSEINSRDACAARVYTALDLHGYRPNLDIAWRAAYSARIIETGSGRGCLHSTVLFLGLL